MRLKVFLTKLARLYFRRYPSYKNKMFVRNTFRKWCVNDELPTWTLENFMMLASPHDYASYGIFFFGEYDQQMTELLKHHIWEGAVCWDIGTERGWFSLLMGKLVGPTGRVDSFEAYPPNFKKLEANISLNKYTWINPFNLAVSNQTGNMYFVPPSDEVTNNVSFLEDCGGVGYLTSNPQTGCIEVPTITLDIHAENTKLDRLDFIKIDIEGAEVDALKGAEKTIRRFRPKIAIEYNFETAKRAGTSVKELDDLLEKFGYDRFTFNGKLELFQLEKWDLPGENNSVFNVYCFPRI